jgi:hypothetical protein
MSLRTEQLRADAKAARFAAVVARYDDKGADDLRKKAAHAHVMTHHALEMDTPEAHDAAAEAHQGMADAHTEAGAACMEEPEEKAKPKAKK